MSEYKRLTKQKWSNDIDLTQEFGYSYIYERLHELEDKIANGTLIDLPCKVGDTVYVNKDTWKDGIFFNHTYIERKFFVIGKVTSVRITKNQILARIKSNYQNNLYRYKTSNYPISAFGKTVFLTKAEAEAEARLKELDNSYKENGEF